MDAGTRDIVKLLASGVALPLMTAFGGCASTGTQHAAPMPQIHLAGTTGQTAARPAQQTSLRIIFSQTVGAFQSMGFRQETGLGPDGHRNLCPVTFNNGYRPCDAVTDTNIRAVIPYGPKSPDGLNGLVFEDIVRSVNKTVNEAIIPVPDAQKYRGFTENWSLGRPRGSNETGYIPDITNLRPGSLEDDCDGYVYLKQYMLRERGIASHPMFVKTAADEGHLVLVVLTDQGPVVLDNLAPEPKKFNETPYAAPGHAMQILNFWDPNIYGWHSHFTYDPPQ
ncbi:MAG: transglutaminase-like cysteine peptidase [Alphaproteobacteria bacterium]|nr:transglutaminase-like cysteine peptidase [Alphaproteobacteria bacterium]MCD8520066.1 transglutaminase-like cysteine peptidase [Alphaproteobacteria bacterium]MCD8525670.1 transglutaminase-like cysteine peptidase [Alphaproteobacteria bacterium]MCD8570938.1 transglutaminase-like cysteine peptidase [Alphaproteobacteria bacterium]